jgi:type II secretory pathway pseudopilin PulG
MTLVELLVVVAILGLLAATTIPLLASTAERRGREAAATVSTMAVRANGWARQLSDSSTLAGLTLTPVFIRSPSAASQPEAIAAVPAFADLSVSQTQVDYTGESADARTYCYWNDAQMPPMAGMKRAVFSFRKDLASTLPTRLNAQTATITVAGKTFAFSLIATPPFDLSTADPPIPANQLSTYWFGQATCLNADDSFAAISGAKEYRISLPPIPSLPAPLKMPGEYIVDIGWSTCGSSLFRPITNPMPAGAGTLFGISNFDSFMPVHIMFNTLGDTQSVFFQEWIVASAAGRTNRLNTTDNIYLLVGKVDRAGLPYTPSPTDINPGANWQYPDSRWVRISGRDGAVLIADPVPNATTVFGSQGYARRGISANRL